jgi:hypothetical protein
MDGLPQAEHILRVVNVESVGGGDTARRRDKSELGEGRWARCRARLQQQADESVVRRRTQQSQSSTVELFQEGAIVEGPGVRA